MKILKFFSRVGKIPDGKFEINGIPFFSQRLNENNFKNEGFSSLEDALYWSERICGLACAKMVIKSYIPKSNVALKELLDYGLDMKAYREDAGWFHKGIIKITSKFGIKGGRKSVGKNLEKIAKHIINKELVIASVTVGFEVGKTYTREDGSSYTMQKGGHLVVIYGCEVINGKVTKFLLHHPSSWETYEWKNYEIARDDFLKSFSKKGNIMYFNLNK